LKLFFDESFDKSIKKLKNPTIKQRLIVLITEFESSTEFSVIPSIKKVKGFKRYYSVRLDDYRVGNELIDENIVLLK